MTETQEPFSKQFPGKIREKHFWDGIYERIPEESGKEFLIELKNSGGISEGTLWEYPRKNAEWNIGRNSRINTGRNPFRIIGRKFRKPDKNPKGNP